jgi:hypothetical protein
MIAGIITHQGCRDGLPQLGMCGKGGAEGYVDFRIDKMVWLLCVKFFEGNKVLTHS